MTTTEIPDGTGVSVYDPVKAREAREAKREEKLRRIYEEAIANIEPLDFLASITGLRGSAKGGLIIGLEIDPADFDASVALSKFTPIKGRFHVEPAPYGS